MTAIWQSLHHLTVEQVLFNNRYGVKISRYESHLHSNQLWRLVLRIKYSYNFMSVSFGFAHQKQLQFLSISRLVLRIKYSYNFYECRVWFCASNTVTIFMSVTLSFCA